MAHVNQSRFCKKVKRRLPEYFVEKNILDCGSLDVNGNNRYLFEQCKYIGIDLGPGLNVDVVCPIHSYVSRVLFDTIISTECFEHDMYYNESLNNIVNNLLLPGGMFLFTCASTNRKEHGTRSHNSKSAPLLTGEWANYYKNLTCTDIKQVLDVDNIFSDYEFTTGRGRRDLYFWGIKKTEKQSATPAVDPDDALKEKFGARFDEYRKLGYI